MQVSTEDRVEPPSRDEEAIRTVLHSLAERINRRKAKEIAQLYTPDGDRRDSAGERARGRAEIAHMYKTTLRSLPATVKTRFEFDVRFLRSDVALVDGFYFLSDGRGGPFTIVATKNQDGWLVAAGRQGAALPLS